MELFMHFPFSHKKKTLPIIIVLLFLFIIFLFFGIRNIQPTDTSAYRTDLLETMETAKSFDEFTNALFCYETTTDSITTAYTLKNPSTYHIPDLPPLLSSFSNKEYAQTKKKKTDEKILNLLSKALKRFSPDKLDANDQLTYALLENYFEEQKNLCQYPYYEELLGGSTGVQANLPVSLGEYPLRSEKDIQTYLSLLKQMPAYANEVVAYEKQRAKLGYTTPVFVYQETKEKLSTLTKGLQKEQNCFTDTFDEKVQALNSLSAKEKEKYQKQNRSYVKEYVIPSYQTFSDYINLTLSENSATSTKDTTLTIDEQTAYGLSSLPKGSDYYLALIKRYTGSARPVSELISMTENALQQAIGDVLNIALTDQEAYLYYSEHPLETYYQTPESILEALSLMYRENYPALKKTPAYQVKSVPDSLAPSVSPAFYMIPAIDDYENNTIYINSLYTNEQNGNLFNTLAHEGFPGHLYQTVYFNDTKPDAIRQMLNYLGYVEGWATYVEIDSFSFLKYPLEGDSLCRLYQNDTIINLALCSRIDLGVNYENWTLQDVKKLFTDNGFRDYYASDVYAYVVEAPANYLSYFIGYLEIADLKTAYQQQELEEYSEKEFHQKFLEIGPSDFSTLRDYLLNAK